MNKLLAVLLFIGSVQVTQAQFTIPDPAFVTRLQQLVPNAMNGNMLDTTHVDIVTRTDLSVSNAGISDLSGVQFFDALEVLECFNNQLTSLPSLPNSIRVLQCDFNQLMNLSPLPSSLEVLWCTNNQLTNLPALPNSIVELRCHANQLTSLPSLPNSIEILWCHNNQLTNLPLLPGSIELLRCYNNQLTNLPLLPNSLEVLWCYNNQLSCLPVLPGALDVLQCYGNFINCLPNFPPLLPPFGTGNNQSNLGFTAVLCSPSDSCFPSEVIGGTVFNDLNGNGLQDGGEGSFSNGVAEAQPGNYLSGVDINGNYSIPVDTGMYTVQGQSVLYHTITTPPHVVTITPGQIDSLNHIGYQAIPGIYDLVVDVHAGVTRPGFDNNVFLQVHNIGTEPTTANIDLDFDVDQTFVSSSVTPASQTGTNVNWSLPMNPGDTWNVTVTLNTPVSVPLGEPISHQFAALPAMPDTTMGDNVATWSDIVIGSYDPNDKTASVDTISPTQVINGEWIEYVIRFQNTGTFLAENVRITDTLSSDLLGGTFEYISSSHDNEWYLSNSVLVFQFDNIQLPDSNANEPDSHGFVKFRMKPSQSLQAGDVVENIANIFFDFNEPVITDPSVVVVDVLSGVPELNANELQTYPNPTTGLLYVQSKQAMERVMLMQLDGRLIRVERANRQGHQLDVSNLKQGVYLIQIETGTGRSVSRVVVNR